MAKEKKSAKAKKSSNSAPKNKGGGLSKLLKGITDKVGAKSKATPKASGATKSAAKTPNKTARKIDKVIETEPVVQPVAAAPTASSALATDVVVEDHDVVLTDAEGRRYCRATDCDQIGMVDGYCRYHYLYFWKKIQVRKKILADGKLERYIEELTARYTDKFIELLRKDLRTEKDFLAAVQELELDDSSSSGSAQDEDEAKTYIEEISGVASESSGREDEGY